MAGTRSSPRITNNILMDNACRAISMVVAGESRPLVMHNTPVSDTAGVRVDGRAGFPISGTPDGPAINLIIGDARPVAAASYTVSEPRLSRGPHVMPPDMTAAGACALPPRPPP